MISDIAAGNGISHRHNYLYIVLGEMVYKSFYVFLLESDDAPEIAVFLNSFLIFLMVLGCRSGDWNVWQVAHFYFLQRRDTHFCEL